MPADNFDPNDPWTHVSFEGNARAQRLRLSYLPFAEKIRLVEDMQRLAVQFARARERRTGSLSNDD